MSYVLIETTKTRGNPLYFDRMTGIGPMTTPNLEEAMRFPTEQEARQHPACRFVFTFFQPREVTDTEEER